MWEPRTCTVGSAYKMVQRGPFEFKLQRYSKCFEEEETLMISWKGRKTGALRTAASFLALEYAEGHLFHSTAQYAGEMGVNGTNIMVYTLSPSFYAIKLKEKKEKEWSTVAIIVGVLAVFSASIATVTLIQ